MEVHKEEVMNTFEGDRDKLLSSFCDYQSNLNQASDNPAHWDMALYLSSLNFFGIDSGRKNSITMVGKNNLLNSIRFDSLSQFFKIDFILNNFKIIY